MQQQADGHLTGQIDAIIRRVAAERDALVMRDVLLDMNTRTADYPYVLVDKYGLLVIDVEAWPGASISGNSKSARWKARVKGSKPIPFENPFRANDDRVASLIEALLVCGRRIPLEYFTHLVVFAGSDTSGITLDATDAGRLVALAEFGATLRARYDFAPNMGALDRDDIENLISILTTIDRSDSLEVQDRHHAQRAPRPSILPAIRKTVTEVAISDSTAGVAPAAPRLTGERYPSVVATAPKKKGTSPIVVLALVLLAALALWLFALNGYAIALGYVMNLVGTGSGGALPVAAPALPAAPPAADARTAQDVLRETAPDVYAKAIDVNDPEVTREGGLTTYTFHFLEKGPNGATVLKRFALSFDGSGNLRGAAAP